MSRFKNLYVSNLNDVEIREFIVRQLSLTDKEGLAEKINDVIQKPENKDYIDYLRSPLILSMFILTFSQFPDLPRSKNKFYYNVFETLVTKHDSLTKKGGFQHERKTGLQNEDIETIVKWFSYISLFRGEYSFDRQYLYSTLRDIKIKLKLDFNIDYLIEDLTVSVSLIIVDGQEYKFPHKSFQEYFCASLIKDLDYESKKIIYTNKFVENLTPTNEIANFLSLCAELDKRNFYSLFLIPQIQSLISALTSNSKNEKELVSSFVDLFSFYITFVAGQDGFIEANSYTTGVSLQTKILQYATLNKNGFRTIFALVKSQKIPNSILNKLIKLNFATPNFRKGQKAFEVVFRNNLDVPIMEKFVKSLNLAFYINQILQSLKEKEDELNQELLNEKTQTEGLLNF